MQHFNEDTRVKLPATAHFLRLGYKYQSLKDAQIDFQTIIYLMVTCPFISNGNNLFRSRSRCSFSKLFFSITFK